MEFNFQVNEALKNQITKVKCDLLPEGFVGDAPSRWTCSAKIAHIIDKMGLASAMAQGLQKAITTSEKLRNVNHTVYLLTNPEANSGNGILVGLLKIGRKKLFVFDMAGQHHEMEPLCVLDFYIHESMQRMGCGKFLFEYMLQEEKINPEHLAIDRPSEKFLAFLRKHYNLSKVIPQANNFVIFEGYFLNHPDISLLSEHKRSTLDKQTHSKPWYGSVDSINSSSWITKPPQFSAQNLTSIGKLLQPLVNSNRDAANPNLPLGRSNDYHSENIKSGSSGSVVIDRPEPKRVNEHDHRPDMKFCHTPLW